MDTDDLKGFVIGGSLDSTRLLEERFNPRALMDLSDGIPRMTRKGFYFKVSAPSDGSLDQAPRLDRERNKMVLSSLRTHLPPDPSEGTTICNPKNIGG